MLLKLGPLSHSLPHNGILQEASFFDREENYYLI